MLYIKKIKSKLKFYAIYKENKSKLKFYAIYKENKK